jgi:hypothetical protein
MSDHDISHEPAPGRVETALLALLDLNRDMAALYALAGIGSVINGDVKTLMFYGLAVISWGSVALIGFFCFATYRSFQDGWLVAVLPAICTMILVAIPVTGVLAGGVDLTGTGWMWIGVVCMAAPIVSFLSWLE